MDNKYTSWKRLLEQLKKTSWSTAFVPCLKILTYYLEEIGKKL